MSQFHFTPERYLDLMHAEVERFDQLQDEVARAIEGLRAGTILELGVGAGETARRVLYRRAPLTPDFDLPDRLDDQLRWLEDAGFDTSVEWAWKDLAVVRADRGRRS